jgi:beta-1,2-mannobiose phosphorylase / 1,2-beta-oligomannan phosphorylase
MNLNLERLGILMEPQAGNHFEAWGVLNPACARTASGELLLYPRAVAEGNYSRIEIARVIPSAGVPSSVERTGMALEPAEVYEGDKRAVGGVEDPRVTFVRPLGVYVMTYVALGKLGPRTALAVSSDGYAWRRLGLLRFSTEAGIDFSRYGDKDVVMFPDVVQDSGSKDALAILHRPTYLVHNEDGTVERIIPPGVDDDRPSIWISYIDVAQAKADMSQLTAVYGSRLLATPEHDWESLKIGAGTPPILLDDGWLIYYHGVRGQEPTTAEEQKSVCYQAGAMILDRSDPTRVRYRSPEPVFSPELPAERQGVVPDVVFPTAIDVQGRTLYVFYGAADTRIGVAKLELESKVLMAPSAANEG